MLDMQGFPSPGVPVMTDPITADSMFIDLRAAGVSQAQITRTGGAIRAGKGTSTGGAGIPSLSFVAAPTIGFRDVTPNIVAFTASGLDIWAASASNISQRSVGSYRWSSTTDPTAAADLSLERDAAGACALRNGTNPQAWRVYNTWTDASNYERISLVGTAATDFKIIPEALGTGTLRGLQLGVSGGKLGFYGTAAVTKPAALTASDATLENAVIRIGELEAKLQSLGLLV